MEVLNPDGSPRPLEEAPPLQALQDKVIRNREEIVRTPHSGELRYRQVNAAPVKDGNGKIIGSVSVVRDITEQKKAENNLKAAQRILEEAQSIAHLGSWEWNVRTGELRWSKELFEIYGVESASFTPTMESFGDFIHPDDRDNLNSVMAHLISGGKPVNLDFRIILRDKSIRFLHATTAVSTFDENGKGLIYVGTTQDITERKKLGN